MGESISLGSGQDSSPGEDEFGFIDPGMIGDEFGSENGTVILNLPGYNKDYLDSENYLKDLEIQFKGGQLPPHILGVYSVKNQSELNKILANLPQGVKNLIITGTHGWDKAPLMADPHNYPASSISYDKTTTKIDNNINVFFWSCYQGKFKDKWGDALGVKIENVWGYSGRSSAVATHNALKAVINNYPDIYSINATWIFGNMTAEDLFK